MNCSPQSLVAAASCFASCIPQRGVHAVKNFILCKIATVGLSGAQGPNLIPPGSTYPAGGQPIFNLTVLANTTYEIIWGSQEQSMTMGTETYVSGGNGSVSFVYTNGNTNMAFLGTNNGATVTVMVFLAPKATPIPGDFTFAVNAGGTTATATWDAPPAGISLTELWTSTDGVTYNLAATVNAPGTSATVTAPTSGNVLYGKARWLGLHYSAFTQPIQLTANANLLTNLISAWHFDENIASGARADSAGTNNLTDVNSNVASSATAIHGRSISITSAAGMRLNHADNASLSGGAGVSFSIAIWARNGVIIANTPLLSKWGATTDYILWQAAGTANLQFGARNLANNATAFADTAAQLPINTFTHIVCGYDNVNQVVWIAVNGGAKVTAALVGVQRTAANFTVGGYDDNTSGTFDGVLDEVTFWNRVLSASEITQLYNAGAGIFYPFS